MPFGDYLRELRPNALWQLIWSLAGPTVTAALTALVLKVQGISLGWWALGIIFVGSLIVFIYASERLHRGEKRQEGEKGIRESVSASVWSVLGWVLFGLAVPALFSALTVQYMTTRFNKQIAQLRKQIEPRILTVTEKERLIQAADRVPPDNTYSLQIEVVDDCIDCSGLAEDLFEAWGRVPRWKVQYFKNPTLRAQSLWDVSILEGIKECSIREKLMIEEVLARIQIKYILVLDDAQSAQRDVCTIFVGRKLPG